MALIKLAEKPLKCFEYESKKRGFNARVDRGIQVVEIDKIVGSVGRCLDFDAKFSLKAKHNLPRLQSIKDALQKQKPLPLVELYKMKDEYYVVDGHHRIAAAKEMGQKFIDAHVIEYLPPANNDKHLLLRKKIEFEHKTSLQGIELSHRYSYDKLLEQIKQHHQYLEEKEKRNISFQEAARDWFQSVYFPVIEEIRKVNLCQYLRNATVGDIYVYLCDQIDLRNRKNGRYKIKIEDALEEFGLLSRATKLIFSTSEGLKEKFFKIFLPCFYQRCPYIL